MNFLFGAVLLILLILPGILFRLAYISVPSYSKAFKSSFQEEILFAVGPAFLLQSVGYIVTQLIQPVDENQVYLLLINNDKATLENPITSIEVGFFLVYNIVLGSLAILIGWQTRKFTVKTNLHQRFHFLRLFNDWEIFFEGYILENPDQPGTKDEAKHKWIDVLIENKGGDFIYSGFLVDYVVNKDEKLERIYLSHVQRRKLEADAQEEAVIGEANEQKIEEDIDKRYYFMPGNYFVIPADRIKNINITYYDDSDESGD